jgi:hypothetical protein
VLRNRNCTSPSSAKLTRKGKNNITASLFLV